jgi:hypothetical protein
MGRANQKSRKGKHQHLPKVGSATELEHDGAREREALLETMGMGGRGTGNRVAMWVLAVAIIAFVIVLAFFGLR